MSIFFVEFEEMYSFWSLTGTWTAASRSSVSLRRASFAAAAPVAKFLWYPFSLFLLIYTSLFSVFLKFSTLLVFVVGIPSAPNTKSSFLLFRPSFALVLPHYSFLFFDSMNYLSFSYLSKFSRRWREERPNATFTPVVERTNGTPRRPRPSSAPLEASSPINSVT